MHLVWGDLEFKARASQNLQTVRHRLTSTQVGVLQGAMSRGGGERSPQAVFTLWRNTVLSSGESENLRFSSQVIILPCLQLSLILSKKSQTIFKF